MHALGLVDWHGAGGGRAMDLDLVKMSEIFLISLSWRIGESIFFFNGNGAETGSGKNLFPRRGRPIINGLYEVILGNIYI
jgi:hypothetical protein